MKDSRLVRIVNRIRGMEEGLNDDEGATSKRFELEISHAGTRLATAIREQDHYWSKEGLELFDALARDAVSYQQALRLDAVDPRRSGGPGLYGNEWRMLLGALGTIQEAASACPDQRIRSNVVNFFLSLSTRLMRDGQYPAARDVSGSLGWLWSDMESGSGFWNSDDSDYFLMRLRETANYSAPVPAAGAVNETHANIYCSIFARLARISISASHAKNARDTLETFAEARQYANADDYQTVFRNHQDATQLAILGWLLLSGPKNIQEVMSVAEMLMSHLESQDLWATMAVALDEEFKNALDVSWWELDGKTVRGRASGVIEIDAYIRIAALVTAGRRGHLAMPADPTERDGDLAWTLAELLKNLDTTNYPRLEPLLENNGGLATLSQELQAAIEERDRLRSEKLASAELDQSLVTRFHDAVSDSLMETRSILDLLPQAHVSGLPTTFGFKQFEHKWWFVNSYVSADPHRLAETFVSGIRRGEDRAVIEAIQQAVASDSVAIEGLTNVVREWCQAHPNSTGLVIVTNSWRATEHLSGASYDRAGEGEPLRAEVADLRIPLYQAFDSEPPYVAIFASPAGIKVSLGLLDGPGPHEVVHARRLLSSVRAPTEQETNNSEKDQTASLAFRQMVVVEVVEGLEVTATDPSQLAQWLLPEDSY